MLENINEYVLYVLTFLGACSVLAHSLEPLVKLTKTDTDDKILDKINLVLNKLQSVLSAVAAPKKPQ